MVTELKTPWTVLAFPGFEIQIQQFNFFEFDVGQVCGQIWVSNRSLRSENVACHLGYPYVFAPVGEIVYYEAIVSMVELSARNKEL